MDIISKVGRVGGLEEVKVEVIRAVKVMVVRAAEKAIQMNTGETCQAVAKI